MRRRDLLRLLAGATAVPIFSGLSPTRLFAIGLETHGRLRRGPLRLFDAHQNDTVTTIAEQIIPETDTPGARAAGVNEFIDLIVAEWYDDEERTRFLNGLAGLDLRSVGLFGKVFTELADAEQVALLSGLDAELTALREADADPDRHFFQQMKWLTLYGYYTSEIGMKEELAYEIVPGRYDPCVATGLPPARGN